MTSTWDKWKRAAVMSFSVVLIAGCGEGLPEVEEGDATVAAAISAEYQPGDRLITTIETNHREGPGLNFDVIRAIPPGSNVYIANRGAPRNGYYKVFFKERMGWAFGPYLRSTKPLLESGLHPDASDAFREAGVTSSQILQTIGSAPASAGVHLADGSVGGHSYCAATDISVRGLSETKIKELLLRLGDLGFAGWYRKPGYDGWPSSEVAHIHVVYAGVPMKSALSSQVDSWLAGRNGLVSNSTYNFLKWGAHAKAVVTRLITHIASPGPTPVDSDGDGIADLGDNCRVRENPAQHDLDQDGIGNLCDTDIDNDGVLNEDDNCPRDANPAQTDADNDGQGNACEP